MRKFQLAWLGLVVACGTHAGPATQGGDRATPPTVPAVTPPTVPTSTTPTGQAPAVVKTGGRAAKIEAPHGGAITTLAVTPDGAAAVSVDELGGVRLWPTLDGSVEPRIVDLPVPRQLAVMPEPRGFVIAMLDEVGSLVIEVVDKDGLGVQRANPPSDPAFKGVEATAGGPLAWRADQIVMRFAADGHVIEQLGTEPGQRLVTIAVGGDKAVAVIESGTDKLTRRARWLTLEPKLAWGGWIDAGDDVGRVIALSPSGKRLAMLSGTSGQIAQLTVIETAKGTLVGTQNDQAALGVVFVDDEHLALASNGTVAWAKLDAKTKPKAPVEGQVNNLGDSGLLAAGGGHAVGAMNGELMIATPTKIEYLGYDLESPAVAAVAPKGQLMIGVGDTFALLDANLRAVASPELGVLPTSAVSELKWVGGDDWLVESSRISDGMTTLALVDASTKKTQVLRTDLAMVQLILHEPATGLVTLSLGDAPEVSKFDPAKHKLEKLATLPKPKGYEQSELVPVVPALAGGNTLVVVNMRDRMTLRWVKDPKVLDKGPSITVDGSLAGVDAAGHAFVWQNTPTGPLELVIYVEGKRIGTLPTDGPVTLWPDAKGTRVVQVGQRSVGLVTVLGKQTWLQSLQFVTEALWLDDGSIVVVSAGGLARLDANTGSVIAARCGWRFGLSAKQHPPTSRVEPVCAQLR
ncbi:MAG: hypothetical protein IPQ07_07930 [Myxococcales bacterium]|nr:hypothetical protein [Myxococcales bacterium]